MISGILVAVLSIGTVGMAAASGMDEEQALPLVKGDPVEGFGEAGFKCGAMCNGVFIHVVTCYGSQTCCGYHYCSTGNSQGTCCNAGQTCSWNGVGKPGAIYCIATP